MKKLNDVIIQGGSVVTGKGINVADVLVNNGQIQEISNNIKSEGASTIINARDKYVMPGAIDAHAHPVYSDKMDQYSITAAYGGVTTIIAFVGNIGSWGFNGYTVDIIKKFIDDGEKSSYLDFAVHGAFSAADESTIHRSIPQLIRMGVPSFKVFMSYKRRGMMMSDESIVKVMDLALKDGGLTMVHAENGCCIEYLTDKFIGEGKTSSEWFLPSQPNYLEAEAINRAATYSRTVGSPLYPVHVSTKEALPIIRQFRESGLPLFTETCPHYLTLTNTEVISKGPLAKVGPPLREKEDCEALWEALADGTIDVIGSDSGGFTKAKKLNPATNDNIFEAPYGLNTIEFMLPVVWSYGVNQNRISIPRLVQLFCENPAKIFGIYPQKGSLTPGSDADIVIWDPAKKHLVELQHGNTDFSSFEGFKLLGMPELVMQRGEIVIQSDKVVRPQGKAKFLKGNPNTTPYAPKGNKL